MKNLQELFEHELKDLYSAEKQLIAALPKMQKAASDKKLSKAFGDHLKETKTHFRRLQSICKAMDINPGNTKCDAMEGLLEECRGMIKEKGNPNVRDAGLIACSQRVEHYEIAGYGTAVRYAESLGKKRLAKTLAKTLGEEKNADAHLNNLAVDRINKKAMARKKSKSRK